MVTSRVATLDNPCHHSGITTGLGERDTLLLFGQGRLARTVYACSLMLPLPRFACPQPHTQGCPTSKDSASTAGNKEAGVQGGAKPREEGGR